MPLEAGEDKQRALPSSLQKKQSLTSALGIRAPELQGRKSVSSEAPCCAVVGSAAAGRETSKHTAVAVGRTESRRRDANAGRTATWGVTLFDLCL